jgi:hypothetical protein
MHVKLWTENPKGEDNLRDPGADERIMLKWVLKKQGLDWFQHTQYTVQWWVFVIITMDIQVL